MKTPYKNSDDFSWLDFIKSIAYLFGEKKRIYFSLLFVLFIVLFYSVVPPLIIGKTVDFFTKYKSGQSLAPFYFYAALLGVSAALASFIRLSVKKKMGDLGNDITYDIKVRGFDKLLSQSLEHHGQENTGSKDQKIQNGVVAFKDFSNILNNGLLPALSSTIGVFVVFLVLSPIYVFVIITYSLGFAVILNYFYKRLSSLSSKRNVAMESSGGSYIEGLNNIMSIKSSGAEHLFKGAVAKKEEVRKLFDKEIIRVSSNQWIVFQIFNSIYYGGFLLIVGRDVILGNISVGSIIIFFSYMQSLSSGAADILNKFSALIDIKASFARMMLIFWADGAEETGTRKFPKIWETISITSGNYAYKAERKDAELNISDMNLTIAKNQKVGIIGKTGSGKSTLAKLLIGLYPLQSGYLKIGTTKFTSIKREEIFKHMAIVLQESEMFNISLKENITLFGNFDEELFNKAIKIAQLEEVVAKLSNGFETLIGEKGYHMSGGERQRVGIARAIYKNPEIIIFDEATSSLDVNTEKKIQKAITAELLEKTIVIVAHRTNTLEDVDVIYEVGDGRIIKQGTYKEFFGVGK